MEGQVADPMIEAGESLSTIVARNPKRHQPKLIGNLMPGILLSPGEKGII
jgi:hypothetical protein